MSVNKENELHTEKPKVAKTSAKTYGKSKHVAHGTLSPMTSNGPHIRKPTVPLNPAPKPRASSHANASKVKDGGEKKVDDANDRKHEKVSSEKKEKVVSGNSNVKEKCKTVEKAEDKKVVASVTTPQMVTTPTVDRRKYLARRTIAKFAWQLDRSSLTVARMLRNEYKLSPPKRPAFWIVYRTCALHTSI